MQKYLRFIFCLFIFCNSLFAEDLNLAQLLVSDSKPSQAADKALLKDANPAGQLQETPGVFFYSAGGISGLPVIHGLNDDRIKIVIDGKTISSACANHMNPALSYIDNSNLSRISVLNKLPSVAYFGDSITDTIVAESEVPYFSDFGLQKEAQIRSIYRSNNDGLSEQVRASAADDSIFASISGSYDRSNSYFAADGNKVNSTQYEAYNQSFNLAGKSDNHLITFQSNFQKIPYQGFVNQYMDLTDNTATSISLRDQAEYGWGKLDSNIYWQDTTHEMGFFSDEKTGSMPMESDGRDLGYNIKAEIPLSANSTLRLGNDYHRFDLEDKWPAIEGSMMMGPMTYMNINDGYKQIFGNYLELEYRPDSAWVNQAGIRNNTVQSDTGDVQAYNTGMAMSGMGNMASGMNMDSDSEAANQFNSRDRSKQDNNIDVSLQSRYQSDDDWATSFGYTRKVRSPNLYERYSWGRSPMAMSMIGWYGDANGYVGDIDLKPEVAHTVSSTFSLLNGDSRKFGLDFTPYASYVEDFIDADKIGEFNPKMSMDESRSLLQFANHDARLYGFDLSADAIVSETPALGEIGLKNVFSYVKGSRTDRSDGLYHIMPFNSRFSVEQRKGKWLNSLEAIMVDNKSDTDTVRQELQTPGYMILNLTSSYTWESVKLDFAITNLLDTDYSLPLGGVDYADWSADGGRGRMLAVPGQGQSVNVGVTIYF